MSARIPERGSAPRRSRGFSLLEVLVAFTIFALVVGGLFQVFGTGLRGAHLSESHTRAVLLAQSKLAELDAAEGLTTGEERGRFDERFRWRVRIEPYAEQDHALDELSMQPLTTTVEVFWGEGKRERSVTLTTLHLVRAP